MKRLCSALLCALLCLMSVMTFLPLKGYAHSARELPPFEMPETFDTSRNYEITFWAKNDTNKAQTNVYHKAIDDFEALYPNIKVTMRLYTDYSRIYNDVITNIATSTTPNVCITYPDHIATYLTGTNIVAPLEELTQNPKYGFGGSELRYDGPENSEMISKFMSECYVNGSLYAVPFMRSTEACYINKTFVEKLGYTIPDKLTWDFVWEVSDAAAEKDADGTYKLNGQKVMIPFIYKSTDNMMIQMLRQKNAGYSDSDGNIEIFNDTTKELLYNIANHVKTGAFSTFKISSYPANFLNAGQCVFAIDSTAGSTWMGSDAPLSDISEEDIVEFETVVKMIPQFDTGNPYMISQGPSICLFNKDDSQEVLASWLFAQFLLTNDIQIGYAKTEGYIPVTTKASSSPEYQEYLSMTPEKYFEGNIPAGREDRKTFNKTYYPVKLDSVKMFLENIDNTFTTPVWNGSASLRDAAGQMIENVTKSVRRRETVDEKYMNKLFSDVTSLYRLDQVGSNSQNQKGVKKELGPMPAMSVILLAVLAAIWIAMGIHVLVDRFHKK